MIFVSRDNILEDDLSFLTNDRSLFFASLELYDLHTKYPFHDLRKAHSAVCVVPYHILPQKVLEYIYEIVGKAYFPLFIRTKIYNSQFYNTSSKHKILKKYIFDDVLVRSKTEKTNNDLYTIFGQVLKQY